MNGKFILLLVISFNIVGLLVTTGYQDINPDSDVDFGNNYMISIFFDNITTQDIQDNKGISFNDKTEDAAGSAKEGQEGGEVQGGEGIVNFILSGWDVVKMIGGFLSLLTPIPIIVLFMSLQVPTWLLLLIAMPIGLLYLVAIMEFIRGGTF
jgi:hypothetical protein